MASRCGSRVSLLKLKDWTCKFQAVRVATGTAVRHVCGETFAEEHGGCFKVAHAGGDAEVMRSEFESPVIGSKFPCPAPVRRESDSCTEAVESRTRTKQERGSMSVGVRERICSTERAQWLTHNVARNLPRCLHPAD